ncbi:MAG TPA: response regulator [Pyrinomonadaceae bacterium]|jgi:CheY-like chemotaxis protein|nr:response regulator [Pyrinomonadaceae bacterium]
MPLRILAIFIATTQKGKPHMTLTKELFHKIADPTLTTDERAWQRCELSKQLEMLGNYEAAREAMGEFWRGIGERPVLNGLESRTAAEVLLRVGTLTGWLGSSKQCDGAQEKAKNLIYESIRIFQALPDEEKVAESQTEIAVCYWREGAFDEARVMLQDALSRLDNTDSEVKAVALLRCAVVEASAKRFNDALRIHTEATPLFRKIYNDVLKGKFHHSFAGVLNDLSAIEPHTEYVDRALIEFTAASYYYEQAGHARYQACVENNLGFLFSIIGRFAEAHEHLDRAQALLTPLKDNVHLAQLDDTRAKALLAEGRIAEAEKLAASAVRTLERGGQQSLYAEALTTHGIALARLGRYPQAHLTLQSAVEVAEIVGDLESAGQAAMTIIEECGSHLSKQELSEIYVRADELLGNSQNMATLKRLRACVRRVLFLTHVSASPLDWTGFSFRDAVRRYESHLIERALKDADGMVSRAAQLLGVKHHQSLVSILKNRHKHLLNVRTPIVPRKRSIIRSLDPCRVGEQGGEKASRPMVILHVEDNRQLAGAVRESLEEEGWRVETCADGVEALHQLAGETRYDLLLFDNELPGASGIELVRRARGLSHRRQTPIIMFSASDCEANARRAGVDAFLRKPQDISRLVATVGRLLAEQPP